MYHQWEARFYAPLHLLFKGGKLFLFVRPVPVIVESHLSYGYETVGGGCLQIVGKLRMKDFQLVLPAFFHLFGVQTKHGIGITGVAAAHVEHGVNAFPIDSGQEHLPYSSFFGPLDNCGQIVDKFFTVKVGMGVYNVHCL